MPKQHSVNPCSSQKARSPAFSTQKRTLALATISKLKIRFEALKKALEP
jgi:hypothetical protein